jgi:hypothetical protein
MDPPRRNRKRKKWKKKKKKKRRRKKKKEKRVERKKMVVEMRKKVEKKKRKKKKKRMVRNPPEVELRSLGVLVGLIARRTTKWKRTNKMGIIALWDPLEREGLAYWMWVLLHFLQGAQMLEWCDKIRLFETTLAPLFYQICQYFAELRL